MRIIILGILFFNIFDLSCEAQSTYSIGVHLNPIISYNHWYSVGTQHTKMKPFDIGLESGIKLNKQLNQHIQLTSFFKYYRVSQKLMNQDFNNQLSPESYNWAKISFETSSIGILQSYNFKPKSVHSQQLCLGVSFNMLRNNLLKTGYHFSGNEQSSTLRLIEIQFSPNAFVPTFYMIKPIIGYKTNFMIRQIGLFEFNAFFHLNTKQMQLITIINYWFIPTMILSELMLLSIRFNHHLNSLLFIKSLISITE